jgi:Caspase domain
MKTLGIRVANLYVRRWAMSERFVNGHAVLVGVGGDLPVTVRDASELHRVFTDPKRGAYPLHQASLLVDAQADRNGILSSLDRLAERVAAAPDAVALVYFSGHGGKFMRAGKAEYFLVPSGFNPADRVGTAISDAEFTAKIEAIKARRLIVVLDCCFAAGLPQLKAAGDDSAFQPSSLPPALLSRLDEGMGSVVVASSRDDEYSYVGKDYSVFTEVLLEALAGRGAASQDGFARVLNVLAYLFEEVPKRRGEGSPQHPFVKKVYDLGDNFPICYYAGGAKVLPASFGAEPTPALDHFAREMLEKRRDSLRQQVQTYETIVAAVQQAIVLETNAVNRIKTEEQLRREEAHLGKVYDDLHAVEETLG